MGSPCVNNEDGFATLEKGIAVDHGGSVLTKKPIDFGGKDFIDFTEDESLSPNFLGDEISLCDFVKGNYTVDEDI